ncbi:MAG: AAA family ATPase, partial [Bacteroidota bacterium]
EFEDGRILPFDLLSDGQRSMLALAGDLAMRMTRLNPSLREDSVQQTPGVVLIDELDLHLHPLWQRQIVGDLRRTFPAVQFIATTHSPFIIQSLQPGELYDLATGERPAAEEYVDQSIEDIAEDVMHTPLPQKSRRYLEMMEAAEDYYHQLETGAPREAVSAAKIRLDEKTMPFSDDPAFQALLALERKRSQGN